MEESQIQFTDEEQAEIDRFCLLFGSDIKAINKFGGSLLFTAARGYSVAVMKYLVFRGGDIHVKDHCGTTLLHVAATLNNDIGVVKYLVATGIDVNVQDCSNSTPLDWARIAEKAGYTENAAVIEYLEGVGGKSAECLRNCLTPCFPQWASKECNIDADDF